MGKKDRRKTSVVYVSERSKACPICFMGLTAQTYNELLQGDKKIYCLHCNRELILKKSKKQ